MRPHPDHHRFEGLDAPGGYPVPTTCQAPGCINHAAHKHHAWSRTAVRRRGGGGWPAIVDTQTGDTIKNLVALCHLHHEALHRGLATLDYTPDTPAYHWTDAHGCRPLKGSALLDGLNSDSATPPAVPVERVEEGGSSPGEDGTAGGAGDAPAAHPSSSDEDHFVASAGPRAKGVPPCHTHDELEPGEACPYGCGYIKSRPRTKKAPTSVNLRCGPKAPVDEAPALNQMVAATLEYMGLVREVDGKRRAQRFAHKKFIEHACLAILQDPRAQNIAALDDTEYREAFTYEAPDESVGPKGALRRDAA